MGARKAMRAALTFMRDEEAITQAFKTKRASSISMAGMTSLN
jgi:hypothetical protein